MAYYYKPHKNRIKNPPKVIVRANGAYNCGGKYGCEIFEGRDQIYNGKNNVFRLTFGEEDPDELSTTLDKLHIVKFTREEAERIIHELQNALDTDLRK